MDKENRFSRASAIIGIGGAVVAVSAVMKILIVSLDQSSEAQMFSNQGILAGFIITLMGIILGKRKFNFSYSLLFFVLFGIWAGVRSYNGDGLSWVIEIMSSLFAGATAGFFFLNRSSRRLVFGIASGVVALIAVNAIGQEYLLLPELREAFDPNAVSPEIAKEFQQRLFANEVFSSFTISNALAAFCVLLFFPFFFIVLSRVQTKAGIKNWFGVLIPGVLILVTLLLTRSKGGFLAFGFGAVLALYYYLLQKGILSRLKLNLMLAGVILLGVLSLGALIAFAPPQYGKDSAMVRAQYYLASTKMIADAPIVGSGTASFAELYPAYTTPEGGEVKHAHNDYLEMTVETGLVGILLFLAGIVFLFVGKTEDEEFDPNEETMRGRFSLESKTGKPISETRKTAFISALLVWLGMSLAIALFGACCYNEILDHVREGELIWIAFLLITIVLPLVSAFFVGGMEITQRTRKFALAGIVVGVLSFLVHCKIDFNLYNEGAILSFFVVAGILLGRAKPLVQNRIPVVILLVIGLLVFVLAGAVKSKREEHNRAAYHAAQVNKALKSGSVSFSADDFKKLKVLIGKETEVHPLASPGLYTEKAEMCKVLANRDRDMFKYAFMYFEKASRLAPRSSKIRKSMAEAALEVGEKETALQQYDLAVRFSPTNAKLLAEYIKVLLGLGKTDKARDVYPMLQTLLKHNLPVRYKPSQELVKFLEEKLSAAR